MSLQFNNDIEKFYYVVTKTFQKYGQGSQIDVSGFLNKGDVNCFTEEFDCRSVASSINLAILKEEIKIGLLDNVKQTVTKGSVTTNNSIINAIFSYLYSKIYTPNVEFSDYNDFLNNLIQAPGVDLVTAVLGNYIASRKGYNDPMNKDNTFEDYFKIDDERFKFEDNLVIKQSEIGQIVNLIDYGLKNLAITRQNAQKNSQVDLEIQKLLGERNNLLKRVKEIDALINSLRENPTKGKEEKEGSSRI